MATMEDPEAFTEANRNYFDEMASRYDAKPWQRKMTEKITSEIQSKLDFIGVDWADKQQQGEGNTAPKQVRLLDYACGPGTVTRGVRQQQALAPHITHAIGLDISPNMVDRYNALFSTTPTAPPTYPHPNPFAISAHAHVADLLATPLALPTNKPADLQPTGELSNFDIAAVGLGFHHFASPALALERLAARLRDGGVLLVIDFHEDDDGTGGVLAHAHGHSHSHSHHHHHNHSHSGGTPSRNDRLAAAAPAAAATISAHGFSERTVRALFAGVGDTAAAPAATFKDGETSPDEAAPTETQGYKTVLTDVAYSVMPEEVELEFPVDGAGAGLDHADEGRAEATKVVRGKVFLARATKRVVRANEGAAPPAGR